MSNVIKSGQAGWTNGKIIAIRRSKTPVAKAPRENDPAFSPESMIKEAHAEAKRIIEKATLEADNIQQNLVLAEQKIEERKRQILQKAREEGYKKGFTEGKEAGLQEASHDIKRAKKIIEDAKKETSQYIQRSERTILTIALRAAEKITKLSLDENKENFLPLVKKAVEEIKDYDVIQIYVHPKYYSLLISEKDEVFSYMLHNKQIYIYPNEELKETDCVIETDGGKIDAGIDTQFQELREKLYELYIGESHECH